MKLGINRRGFAGIAAVIIIAAIVIGVGFFLTRSSQKTTPQTAASQDAVPQKEVSQEAALREGAIALVKSQFPKDKYSYVYFVPRSIVITAPKDDSAFPLNSYLGLQFRTTKSGQLSEQSKKLSAMKQIIFSESEKITMAYTGTSTPREQLSAEFDSGTMKQFEDAFGSKLDSGYDFKDYLYSSSPDMLTTAMSLEEIEARGKAVILKSTMSLFSSDEFYKFETKNARGFFGKNGSSTLIEIFLGPHLYSFFRLTSQPSNDEVNLIISSARRVE